MNTPEAVAPVVVGVDGSPASKTALAWAAHWAELAGRPVRLLTAEHLRAPSPLIEDQVREDVKAKLRAEAVAVSEAHPGLVVSADVAWISPAEALVEASRAAAAVVLGNRGVGGWHGLTLGSVSATVSSHAHCGVVVVPERFDQAASQGEVVLGVDGSPEALEAAEFAFEQAALLATSVCAVHVRTTQHVLGVPVDVLSERGPLPSPEELELLRSALQSVRTAWPDVDVRERFVAGNPARELAKAAEGAAMVVVGSRGLGGFRGLLLGSTSRDLLQAMPCPVAVARYDATAA